MKKNKVGRPAIAESKKRNIYVCISCTKDEVTKIDRKAKQYDTTRSEVIRMAIEKNLM